MGEWKRMSGENIELTVVIAARNEEDVLERCLKSIPRERCHTIVVDDASTDKTAEIAGALAEEYYKNTTSKGAIWSWDYGVRKAHTELVMILAADSCLDDTIIRVFKHFEDSNVMQVVPKFNIIHDTYLAKLQKIHDKVSIFTHDLFFRTKIGEAPQNVGITGHEGDELKPWSHAPMRRSYWLKVNPPTENVGVGQELRFEELAVKLPGEIIYDPKINFNWHMYDTLPRRFVQQRYYGRCVWTNMKKPTHLLKLHRCALPTGLLGMLVFPGFFLLSAPFFFRLMFGGFAVGGERFRDYLAYCVLSAFDSFVFTYGVVESLVYRGVKGCWMVWK